jgi:hypothetical protein
VPFIHLDEEIAIPGEVQCGNDGLLSAAISGERVAHLTNQLYIEACDTHPFISEHSWKYKGPKRFNGNSNTDLALRTNSGQFIACKRVHQFHSIEDKSASLQKESEPYQERDDTLGAQFLQEVT